MIIKNKFSGYAADGSRTYNSMGGPTTNKTETSNIPSYAKPYVQRMMGATEGQIYTKNDTGDITGFQPYKPFEGETVAGFSPMQAQAMRGVQNYQLPGQTGMASQMTSGLMGAALQPSTFREQGTAQSYMSPYIQNALAPQMDEARRQYGITGQQQAAQAVQQGAFGGGRHGIVEAENARNLAKQQESIYGQGMQSAFGQAQQQYNTEQQQRAAQIQQGLAGASQLGALGQQQYGQEMGLLGQQQAVGAQQQAYEQQRLNQVIQNYATEQQYPFIQLGTLSNMLRGLPMQASTTQMYQAQPSLLQQGIGLAGAGANLYQAGAFGKKEGGAIKEMAGGGIATGVSPYELPSMLGKLSDKQLQTKASDTTSDPETAAMVQAENQRRTGMRKSAGIAQMASGGAVAFAEGSKDAIDNPFKDTEEEPKAVEKAPAEKAPVVEKGLATRPAAKAPAPAPKEDTSYGSIVKRGLASSAADSPEIMSSRAEVKRLQDLTAGGPEAEVDRKAAIYKKLGIDSTALINKQREEIKAEQNMTAEEVRKNEHMRWAQMFAKFGSTPGPILKAALTSINDTIPDLLDDQAKAAAVRKEVKKALYELDKTEYLEKKNKVDEAIKTHETNLSRITTINIDIAKIMKEEELKKLQVAGELEERAIASRSAEKVEGMRESGVDRRADIAQQAEERKQAEKVSRDTALANQAVAAYDKATATEKNRAEMLLSLPSANEEAKKMAQSTLDKIAAGREEKKLEAQAQFPDSKINAGKAAPVAFDASAWGNPVVKTK